jgi:hypothetical protein
MNFVALEWVITIASIGSKHCLEKGSRRSLSKNSKFGTFYVALRFGLFGLNAMTKCSTTNNGMNLRSNIRFGMSYSSLLRRRENGLSSKSRLVNFPPWPCSKELTVHGEQKISFVKVTIFALNGIGGEE